MKILLFTLEYPPFRGGIASYCRNLVKYWPASSSSADGPASASAGRSACNADISVLNNNDGLLINEKLPFLKWLPACLALRKKIKQENIDHVLTSHILPLGIAALICRKIYGTKYSIILHGMDLAFALKRARKKWIANEILKNAQKIICANGYTAEIAAKHFSEIKQKISIVNPGAEHDSAPPRYLESLKNKYALKDKMILLSVCRLVKRKGVDSVINLMPKILEKIPNLVYVVIGAGEESENIKSQIANLKLEQNTIMVLNAGDREKNAWYDVADIFIMPCKDIKGDFEGFGIVYLEANLAGKPVIAGKSGGTRDAVEHGLNGLLVDPEDADQIFAAIVALADNPMLRRELGERGRERAKKYFNWAKQVKKICQEIS